MSVNTVTNYTITATMSAAEFRLIGAFFEAVMTAGGFIKTGDTGQIDWTTVNWPGANSTSAGYEIRRFSDGLHATAPMYFKISYRRGSGANVFEIGISVGLGSDGAGNLTSVRLTEILYSLGTTTVAALLQLSCSADTWGTMWFSYANSVNNAAIFCIERTADLDGTLNDNGCIITWIGVGSFSQRFVPRTGTVPPVDTAAGSNCLQPASQTSGLDANGDIVVYPIFPHADGGAPEQPARMVVCAYANNFALNSTPTLEIRGTNATYLAPPIAQCPNHTITGVSGANTRFLMRYQ